MIEIDDLAVLVDEITQLEKDLVVKEAELDAKKLDLVAGTYKIALQMMKLL